MGGFCSDVNVKDLVDRLNSDPELRDRLIQAANKASNELLKDLCNQFPPSKS